MIDYQINPVIMAGKIKSISEDGLVKINLNGRLGVIKIPTWMIINKEELEPLKSIKFYFSYVKISDLEIAFDKSDLSPEYGLNPTIIPGKIREINDTAAEISILNGEGSVAVPRRWLFSDVEIKEGSNCELYISCMQIQQND